MGPMLAVFLALSLNLAPADVGTFTIDSYVLEGVGLHSDANTFLLERRADGQWQLHDAHGNPWFLVGAAGHVLSLTDPATGEAITVDAYRPTAELRRFVDKAGLKLQHIETVTREKRPPHFEVISLIAERPA